MAARRSSKSIFENEEQPFLKPIDNRKVVPQLTTAPILIENWMNNRDEPGMRQKAEEEQNNYQKKNEKSALPKPGQFDESNERQKNVQVSTISHSNQNKQSNKFNTYEQEGDKESSISHFENQDSIPTLAFHLKEGGAQNKNQDHPTSVHKIDQSNLNFNGRFIKKEQSSFLSTKFASTEKVNSTQIRQTDNLALKKAKEVQLTDFISEEALLFSLNNPKNTLYEGELQKYKPGVNYNFVSRYVCISLDSIKYFKNKMQSKCYPDRPLFQFPVNYIQSVSAVSFKVPLLPKELERQNKIMSKLSLEGSSRGEVMNNYFEVQVNLSSFQSELQENEQIFSNKTPLHLMPQNKQDTHKYGELKKKISDLTTWSGRSHEWYENEERLIFRTLNKESLNDWVCALNWVLDTRRSQKIKDINAKSNF